MQILIISPLRDDQRSHGLISHIAWGTCVYPGKFKSEGSESFQSELYFIFFCFIPFSLVSVLLCVNISVTQN